MGSERSVVHTPLGYIMDFLEAIDITSEYVSDPLSYDRSFTIEYNYWLLHIGLLIGYQVSYHPIRAHTAF